MARQHCNGFTLMEMSIVLVVIALVIGGILVGRDLIKTAGLRQLGSQIASYNSAVNTFQSKYDCLPGDCEKAQNLFGTSNGAGAGPCPASSYLPTQGTCNGDGNGTLAFSQFNGEEGLRLWEQLSMAQLIPGNYHTTGFPGDAVAGTDYPQLPPSLTHNSQWSGVRAYWYTTPLFIPPMAQGHLWVVGLEDQTHTNAKAALTPNEARWYDDKYDDGLPLSGNVQAGMYNGGSYGNIYSNCFGGTSYVNSDVYNFTDGPDGDGCPLYISADF